ERHPDADVRLTLTVPRVELELGVLGNNTPEETVENGVVVQELGPQAFAKAACMRLTAGPLGTRREAKRHLRRSVSEAPPCRRVHTREGGGVTPSAGHMPSALRAVKGF